MGGSARMKKYGPTKNELQFRIIASLFTLGLIFLATFVKGLNGFIGLELLGIGIVFCVSSIIWSFWMLYKANPK